MKTSKPPDETNKPPETPPAITPVVPPVVTPPVVVPPATITPATSTPPVVVAAKEIGPDDPLPTGDEKVTMSKRSLSERIDRASKVKMKELFGTDDVEVIKANEAKRIKLEADAEKKRLDDMSVVDRAKEEARLANERASAAELHAQEVEEQQAIKEVGAEIKTIAVEFIAPKFWKHAAGELSTHLAGKFTQEQLDAMSETDSEKHVREFFTDYVKENPELAKKDGTTPPAVIERVPVTNGVTNTPGQGATGGKPPPVITTGKYQGKTAAPGHPNSMTAAEFKDWKKSQGITY